MLATLMIAGSSGRGDPHGVRAQRAGDPARDDGLLLAVLLGLQQLLAEVVVDRRVGGAARRAGQRDGRGALALAAHEQLGRGGHEGGVAAADAERRSRTRRPPAARRTWRRRRARRARGRRPRGRARSSRSRPRGSARRRARRRPRSARAGATEAISKRPAGAGSSIGSGGSSQRGGALLEPRDDLLGHVVGRHQRGEREADVGAGARQRDLGHHQVAGREALPVARGAALGREGEAAHRHQARRPPGRRARPPRRAPPARATSRRRRRSGSGRRCGSPARSRARPARRRGGRAARSRTTARRPGARRTPTALGSIVGRRRAP